MTPVLHLHLRLCLTHNGVKRHSDLAFLQGNPLQLTGLLSALATYFYVIVPDFKLKICRNEFNIGLHIANEQQSLLPCSPPALLVKTQLCVCMAVIPPNPAPFLVSMVSNRFIIINLRIIICIGIQTVLLLTERSDGRIYVY